MHGVNWRSRNPIEISGTENSALCQADRTAQSIRRSSENTYAIDLRDATLATRLDAGEHVCGWCAGRRCRLRTTSGRRRGPRRREPPRRPGRQARVGGSALRPVGPAGRRAIGIPAGTRQSGAPTFRSRCVATAGQARLLLYDLPIKHAHLSAIRRHSRPAGPSRQIRRGR